MLKYMNASSGRTSRVYVSRSAGGIRKKYERKVNYFIVRYTNGNEAISSRSILLCSKMNNSKALRSVKVHIMCVVGHKKRYIMMKIAFLIKNSDF